MKPVDFLTSLRLGTRVRVSYPASTGRVEEGAITLLCTDTGIHLDNGWVVWIDTLMRCGVCVSENLEWMECFGRLGQVWVKIEKI